MRERGGEEQDIRTLRALSVNDASKREINRYGLSLKARFCIGRVLLGWWPASSRFRSCLRTMPSARLAGTDRGHMEAGGTGGNKRRRRRRRDW